MQQRIQFLAVMIVALCTTLPGRLAADEPVDREAAPLENLLRFSETIYGGGEPATAAAFERLAKLGVRTVVSVDGQAPNVALAREHGLRYVHIPLGYDGISKPDGQRLAKVIRDGEGPIYVHCHHGRHRGPAAAAVMCIAEGSADHEAAIALLEKARTSPRYAGLWRDVGGYRPPPLDAKLPELVELSEVDQLVTSMAAVSRAMERLEKGANSNWRQAAEDDDANPANEALLIVEGLRESLRAEDQVEPFGEQFAAWLEESLDTAQQLDRILQTDQPRRARELLQSLKGQCQRCHTAYRD